jgi:hypothetical protein
LAGPGTTVRRACAVIAELTVERAKAEATGVQRRAVLRVLGLALGVEQWATGFREGAPQDPIDAVQA